MGIDFSSPSAGGLGVASGPAGDYPASERRDPYRDICDVVNSDMYGGNHVASSVAGTIGVTYGFRFNPLTKRRELRIIEPVQAANEYGESRRAA